MGKRERERILRKMIHQLLPIVTFLATTLLAKPLPRDINVVCPPSNDGYPTFVPHPYDCSLYYQCHGEWPILMECPGDLYWDPDLNVCNWPDQVDCKPKTPIVPTTAVPTTAAPTTAAPTTEPATTAVPTTVVPTTAAPTT